MRAVRTAVTFVCLLIASSAFAQAPVSAADLDRLDATAAEIARHVETLRKSDGTLAGTVERSLAELKDEITYLRVRLRKEGTVPRQEYASLRDRLDTLSLKAQGDRKVSADPVVKDDPIARTYTLPVGTELEVRMQESLSSKTAKVEQRFEATIVDDFMMRNEVAVPAGSLVRGFVSSVRAAGNLDRRGSLTLSFDEMRIGTTSFRLRATVMQALSADVREDRTRIGAGAVVGGVVGAILGGAKGALLGVIVGGGGTIAATEGADVELPAGTVLRIRLDQPLEISVVR